MHGWRVAAVVASLGALAGCAEFTCTPTSIEVASKDTRTRMVDQFRGVTNDQTGRASAVREEKLVPEYWVSDPQGHDYRVTEEQWRAAQPGQSLSVCR